MCDGWSALHHPRRARRHPRDHSRRHGHRHRAERRVDVSLLWLLMLLSRTLAAPAPRLRLGASEIPRGLERLRLRYHAPRGARCRASRGCGGRRNLALLGLGSQGDEQKVLALVR